ncbi:Verruc_Plancto-restricted protein [Fuerstiella marisgermanici]|uniref:Verruc_Plancto-restricted protein n=2 Tax=Fuerstiella marisgermanici TaxID=1891926 RepID=A0A1P8WBK9_9PLAN|nr:Verruc_Plancto-restricted protein [Fuerstiella marisgermanici]
MQLRLKTLKLDKTRRMKTARTYTKSRIYHQNAYDFVFAALRHAQEKLGRDRTDHTTGHVCGRELLEGIAELAKDHFGLLAITVLADWGVHGTEDIGKMVFELIESGEMRKTEDDHLEDFVDVYDFHKVFVDDYQVDTTTAFSRN